MSEPREGQDADFEESDDSLVEGQEPEDEGDEDEDAPPQKPAVDWEKQAHDKAGLAAKERSRRRAAERSNAELRDRFDRLEAQVNSGKASNELQKLIGDLRDDDEDPITDITIIKRVLKQFDKLQADEDRETQQSERMRRQATAIAEAMDDHEAAFKADHPDYSEAASYYRNQRVAELEELGYAGERLGEKLANELFGLVAEALRSDRDPAEVVYGMAKRRGFVAGQESSRKKLQKIAHAGRSGPTPTANNGAKNMTWGDVAKLKGAEQDKAYAALRKRERGG